MFAGCGLALGASGNPEAEVLDHLYAKLAHSFAAGDLTVANSEVLLLGNPGQPISQEDLDDPYGLTRVLDLIPVVSRWYESSGACLSHVYGEVLDAAEATALTDQKDREKAIEARRKLYDRTRPGKPSAAYAAYLSCQAAYLMAVDARSMAGVESQASGTPVPSGLDQAVNNAKALWTSQGKREMVDGLLANLNTFYNENTAAGLTAMKDDLVVGALQDAHPEPWYPVLASPDFQDWLAKDGWSSFTFKASEQPTAPVQVPGAVPQGPKGRTLDPGWVASMRLSVETKRVRISRPWLNASLFQNHAWRFMTSSGLTWVATGNPASADPGLIPLLVTGVLLGRNLMIKGKATLTAVQGGGQLTSLGPFALPTGSSGASSATASTETDALCITCAQPQIIGYFAQVLPKCPDPAANFRAADQQPAGSP